MICLSSPGLENMYVLKNHASQILALNTLIDNEDEISEAVNKVGKIISSEFANCAKCIPTDVYKLGALDEITTNQMSQTLGKLLQTIHKSFSYGTKHELISSVILSSFSGRATSFQCVLGGYFRNVPVQRFNKLYKLGVVCSYDELKRMR